MANWQLALTATVVSLALSSVSAFAQSGGGEYGGGLSLKLPLGDDGSRTAIRPWAHGGSAGGGGASASPDFIGSGPTNSLDTHSPNGAGLGAGLTGGVGGGLGATISGGRRP